MALLYAEQVEYLDLEEMQETHEEEIKMLNEVEKLATDYIIHKSNLCESEVKIDAYIAHVKAHFANEERLMRKYDFSSYDMHKTAHDMFLNDISYAIKQWKASGNVDKVINFIFKSPEWIVLHINTVDAPTAAYIARKVALETQDN